MGKQTLPDMRDWTEEQIAEFWDTHSPLDFEGEMKQADFQFERPKLKPIAVKLTEADIKALKEIAYEQSVGYTTLIRMWIKERIKSEKPRTSRKATTPQK